LLVECWRLALDYQPGIIRKGFGAYATVMLKRRVVDWQRSKYRTVWKFRHRTYERPRPRFVEFDASVRDRLDAAESARAGDLAQVATRIGEGYSTTEIAAELRIFDLLGLGDAA
jgi:hypothetical protein